jgi:16S rRNA (cytidine1402-2'-O)-methyltransferase
VVARELTKLHEAVYRGTLEELAAAAVSDPNLARGEITLLLEGVAAAGEQGADRALLVRALKVLLPEMPPGRAAALAAQIAGVKRSEAYALAQQLRTLAVEGES